jgi:chromosome segregation and condensation protein ScpB
LISEQPRFYQKLASLEAALYSAGHPLDMDALMNALDTRSEKMVRKAVEELGRKMNIRRAAFEVTMLPQGRAVMRLRQDYWDLVQLFTHRPLLTPGPLKTLGYIAYSQPIEQGQVISYRGFHVYGQLKMLERAGLIARERTPDKKTVIKTTSFFADYFGLSTNPERAKLQIIEMFSASHIVVSEELADSGNRLPEGLPQYSGSTNASLE